MGRLRNQQRDKRARELVLRRRDRLHRNFLMLVLQIAGLETDFTNGG